MTKTLVVGLLVVTMLLGCGGKEVPSIKVEPVYPPVQEVKPIPEISLDIIKEPVELTIEAPDEEEIKALIESTKTTPVEVVAPYVLSDEERRIVECVVMGEIGGECYEAQMLVAQCLLNAVLKDGIPPSRVRIDYQYAGWNYHPTDSVKEAVSAVFDRGEKVVDEPILYFYAPKLCNSAWHESQVFVIELGNTRFFKEWN